MGNYGYISVLSLFFYGLMILAFLAAKRDKITNGFVCVLGAMLCWTGGSLSMRMEVWPSYDFWYHVSLAGLLLILYFYYRFVSALVGVRFPACDKIYLFLLSLFFCMNVLQGSGWPVVAGRGSMIWSEDKLFCWGAALFFLTGCIVLHVFWVFWKGFREHPEYRVQFRVLLLGLLLFFVGELALLIPVFRGSPLGILGGVSNVALMLYALVRRRLFRMKMLASEGVCVGIGVILTVLFSWHLSSYLRQMIQRIFPAALRYCTVIGVCIFLVSSLLLSVLWRYLMNNVFVKGGLQQAQRLRDFSSSVSEMLCVESVLGETARVIQEMTEAEQIYICLQKGGHGEYKSCYVDGSPNDLSFFLREDSPLVRWLCKTGEPVLIREFRNVPEYKSMWKSEKKQLSDLGIECCMGLSQGEDLVCIVALANVSGKHSVKLGELDLLASIGAVAAIAIKNVSLSEVIYQEARTDELTGLFNRQYFYEILDREFCENEKGTLALMMIDIDDFKLYNQLYGYQQGDSVLREVAGIVKDSVRERGYAARYSAKEFAVLLPGYDVFSTRKLAEYLHRQIFSIRRKSEDHKLKVLTISVGISVFPYGAKSAKELLENADLAVHHVKRNGKNGTVVFDAMLRDNDLSQPMADIHVYQEYESMIYALTAAIDAKDHYTFSHSNNVAYYATRLAEALHYPADMVEIVRQAALLHDVGKIGIPEGILNKKGKLTQEEYEVMKGHVEASVGIVRHLPSLDYVIPAVIGHHERYDGQGYPRKIAGEEIPASARILCIADSFDAMTSKRCYKERLPASRALEILREEKGKQFDPEMAEVFIDCFLSGQIVLAEEREDGVPARLRLTGI